LATVFCVRASAGRGGFSLSILSPAPLVIRAQIPADPVNGKANRALVIGLEEALGCPVQLLAGQKSRKKTLSAACDASKIIEACRKFDMKNKNDGNLTKIG
jgi:uncharacterized protein YggU (UPF0235/DUF167 family)